MLSAIVASTGAPGSASHPRVAATSVMLCATVNAVIVSRMRLPPRTMISKASAKSRWSTPSRMCWIPSRT